MKIAATFPDTISASIAQGMLADNGIPSMLDNQAMNTLYPTPMSGTSDISLLVNDADLTKAIRLLNSHND